jgi:hypothetical protein
MDARPVMQLPGAAFSGTDLVDDSVIQHSKLREMWKSRTQRRVKSGRIISINCRRKISENTRFGLLRLVP